MQKKLCAPLNRYELAAAASEKMPSLDLSGALGRKHTFTDTHTQTWVTSVQLFSDWSDLTLCTSVLSIEIDDSVSPTAAAVPLSEPRWCCCWSLLVLLSPAWVTWHWLDQRCGQLSKVVSRSTPFKCFLHWVDGDGGGDGADAGDAVDGKMQSNWWLQQQHHHHHHHHWHYHCTGIRRR